MRPQRFQQRLADGQRLAQQMPRSVRAPALNAIEDVGLGLFAEPLQFGHLASLASGFELFHRVDAQFLVQRLDFFRPQPRNVEHRHQPWRNGGLQFVVVGQLAGLDEFSDLPGDAFPDPLDLPQPVVLDDFGQRFAEAFDGAGGVRVSASFEWVFPFKFQQCADLN